LHETNQRGDLWRRLTILDRGAGQPELQLSAGFNIRFLGNRSDDVESHRYRLCVGGVLTLSTA
jgi:hypothetical protein